MRTILLLLTAFAAHAAPLIERDDKAVRVTLDNGTKLEFALHEGLLLGLNQARVTSVVLKSEATVVRPLIAQEWEADRLMWPFLRLVETKTVAGRVELHCELLATGDEQAYRAAFVFTGDKERALGKDITPELAALQFKHDAAANMIEQAVATTEPVKSLDKAAKNYAKQLAAVRTAVLPGLLAESAELRAAQADIETFNAALEKRALEVGKIHRDFYRFAHLQQPEAICNLAELKKLAAALANDLKPAGTLVWVIEPVERNIAGWVWRGWKQHYRFELADNRKVNVLRQLGTWELDGHLDGLTAVNLRYRGLGRIEQPFTVGPTGVNEAFTTTEVMPGAVGDRYVISPALPTTDVKQLSDRGYALLHRTGAWIAHTARGAGHGFLDFQFRPHAALAVFHERQGNLRALTETFPGDLCLSQTDEEFFALTSRHATEPQVFVALAEKLPANGWRTRWQEVDQYVRDLVSDDLKFVQHEPLPGIGLLFDGGWAGSYKNMAEQSVDAWADQGVRCIAVHNPGWVNGRYQGPGGPPKVGGGVCSIYDWWPTKDMEEPWKLFMKACARRDVVYLPWLGQTIWKAAPFAQRIGLEKQHWSLNGPHDEHGPGYEPDHVKGNIFDATFREAFFGQLEKLRQDYGYQGWWADSFQNLFMSQLDWSNGTGNSMQRAWWEKIAEWSRDGVAWMAESHAFPGMSCSIEVAGWENDYWYFRQVWKWYRGGHQKDYSPEQLDRNLFRVMANRGWTAPDGGPGVIPGFKRMAHEYLAALPAMRRSYVLANEAGMLWLSYADDQTGVWFSFRDQPVPAGVTARYILDNQPANRAERHKTYRVKSDDLLKSSGITRGPEKDPRLGRAYTPPRYTWPDWARKEN